MLRQICLNHSILEFMDHNIGPDSFVLEYGSGWSTLWFAERAGVVLSVETTPFWWRTIYKALDEEGHTNTTIELVATPSDPLGLTRGEVDLVLVDCHQKYRREAALHGWHYLAQGGYLVFDDAQREQNRETVNMLNKISGHEPEHKFGWTPEKDVESAVERESFVWRKYTY